jgi:hypothetical protein
MPGTNRVRPQNRGSDTRRLDPQTLEKLHAFVADDLPRGGGRRVGARIAKAVAARRAHITPDALGRALDGLPVRSKTAAKLEAWVRTFEQPHPTEVAS